MEKPDCSYPYFDTRLPLEKRVEDLLKRLSIEEKLKLLPTHQSAVERLGIEEYWVGGEAAHGIVTDTPATVFPQPIGLGCSWDEELLYKIGSAVGDEARAYYLKGGKHGGLTRWAPTIDMERDPRWGRTEEAYGEDPFLTGKLSASLVKGMQGEDPFYLKMVPAPKHFYGNNNEKDRITSSSSIDPRNKYEYYLKAFKRAYTEGKAYSMMTAYNCINGVPCIVNPEVKSIVKGEWGCKGFIVCDGADFSQTVEYHKYYKTHAETIANALKNGIDCFTDKDEVVIDAAREALQNKYITEADIDNALRNIFTVRFKLGQFDSDETNPYSNISEKVICCEKHNKLSLKAAREAVVLLKNEKAILPLKKKELKKAAVIGPLSDVIYRDWYTGIHPYKVTPLKGIETQLGRERVEHTLGKDIVTLISVLTGKPVNFGSKDNGEDYELSDWGFGSINLKSCKNDLYVTTDDEKVTVEPEEVWGWFVKEKFTLTAEKNCTYSIKTWKGKYIASHEDGTIFVTDEDFIDDKKLFKLQVKKSGLLEAVKSARECDTAIIFVGNHPLINGKEEIDRSDIILPEAQEKLIREVHKVNPNTIVVIIGSYPFAINYEKENVPGIIYTSHGSQEIGTAISDVLFGNYSPAGRLNMTWYKSAGDLSDIMDYDIIKGKRTYMYFDKEVVYPFGFGLSYTNFEYSDLVIKKESSKVNVSFYVSNIGVCDSDEVVQVYTKINSSRVKRPFKELKAFKRIHIDSNDKVLVNLSIDVSDLEFYDVTRERYCVEDGEYTFMVGSSSKDIKLQKSIHIEGEKVPNRDLTKLTQAENYDDYNDIVLVEGLSGNTSVQAKSDEAWIRFEDVCFSSHIKSFEAVVSSVGSGNIELTVDSLEGEVIGSTELKECENWYSIRFNISKVSGVHNLYLKMSQGTKVCKFILM